MRRLIIGVGILFLLSGLRFVQAEEGQLVVNSSKQAQSIEGRVGSSQGKVPLLKEKFLGNTIWQYALFLVLILVAVLLARVVDYLFENKMKVLAAKTKTPLDDLAIEIVKQPLKPIIIILAVKWSLEVFTLPARAGDIVQKLLWIAVAGVVAYTSLRIVDLLVAYLSDKVAATRSKLDDQLLIIIRKTLKIFIVTVAVLMIIQNLGFNVMSLLAGLGIGGLAFALAAKETLANMFGSIAIFADKPFRVGERVVVDGYDGPVESVGLRSTRIRTLDGTLVTIPNARMAEASINNISKRPTIKNLYTVGITYDTGYDKMKKALEILRDIFKNHPSTENYWVYFKEFGAYSLNILVIHWCKHLAYEEFLQATEGINLEIMKRFEENSIEMAFPTQTVYLKGEGTETAG